jgi:hypothetical protein
VVAREAAARLLKKKLVIRFTHKLFPNIWTSSPLFSTEEELEALADTLSKL